MLPEKLYGVTVKPYGVPYATQEPYTRAALSILKPVATEVVANHFYNDPTSHTLLAQVEGGYVHAVYELYGSLAAMPDREYDDRGDWGYSVFAGVWQLTYQGKPAPRLPRADEIDGLDAATAIREMRWTMHAAFYRQPHPDLLPQVEEAVCPSVGQLQEEVEILAAKVDNRNRIINEAEKRGKEIAAERDELVRQNKRLAVKLRQAQRAAASNGLRARRARKELTKAS